MKWWEGNVVSYVCLSVHRGGPHITSIYDAIGESQVKRDPLSPSLNPPLHMLKLGQLGPYHTGTGWEVGGWPSTETPSC